MEIKYDKLVRDNIIKIIENDGEIAVWRYLNDEDYWNYLLKKDIEELEEVRNATSAVERKKELADKLELLLAMAEFNGFTLKDLIGEADKKRLKNGGFKKRILLEKIIK